MQVIFSKINKIARAHREIIFHDCAEAKHANHLYKKVFQTLHIFSVKARTTTSNQNNHSLKVFRRQKIQSPVELFITILGDELPFLP